MITVAQQANNRLRLRLLAQREEDHTKVGLLLRQLNGGQPAIHAAEIAGKLAAAYGRISAQDAIIDTLPPTTYSITEAVRAFNGTALGLQECLTRPTPALVRALKSITKNPSAIEAIRTELEARGENP